MGEKVGVLIFPAGEINSVELHDALATCVNIRLFGASSIERHGKYVFKNYIEGLPLISDKDFIDKLNTVISSNNIDILFPTHDTITRFLVHNQELINAKILSGDKRTTDICRDKEKTYDLFANCSFSPVRYKCLDTIDVLPVFVKPKVGQGSVGAKQVVDKKELSEYTFTDHVVTEYLPGEEYTVDCITDSKGELKFASPRSRTRIFSGVSVAGRNQCLTPEISDIAQTINSRLTFLGLWYFQIKKDINGKFKLLEISARCAGSMCLTRGRGVNLPLLSVYAAQGYEVSVLPNSYTIHMDRTLISRYMIDYEFEKVYIDFDDTLIIENKVHLNAIRFIYQCLNSGKKVILLSKHAGNLEACLETYCIAKQLFFKIVHLQEHEKKVHFIEPQKALFIDNSFKERKEVYERLHIPVFDNDTIEVLLDWRN